MLSNLIVATCTVYELSESQTPSICHVVRSSKNAIVAHNLAEIRRLVDFRMTENRQLDLSPLNTGTKRSHQQVVSSPKFIYELSQRTSSCVVDD